MPTCLAQLRLALVLSLIAARMQWDEATINKVAWSVIIITCQRPDGTREREVIKMAKLKPDADGASMEDEGENKDEKKPHRYKPGTVALRTIKKMQKMHGCLVLAKAPFEKVVRASFDKANVESKLAVGA